MVVLPLPPSALIGRMFFPSVRMFCACPSPLSRILFCKPYCQSPHHLSCAIPVRASHQSFSSRLPLSDCSVVSPTPRTRWVDRVPSWFRQLNHPPVRLSTWSHPVRSLLAPWTGECAPYPRFLPPSVPQPPGRSRFACFPPRLLLDPSWV